MPNTRWGLGTNGCAICLATPCHELFANLGLTRCNCLLITTKCLPCSSQQCSIRPKHGSA